MDAMNDIQKIRTQIEQHQAEQEQVLRRTMSVPEKELREKSYSFKEAANILGIHDCDLYDIWKNEKLEYITVDFVRRIPVDIFEKWYADQDVYRKVTHIPTAEELENDYICLQDAADLLGISREKLAKIARSEEIGRLLDSTICNNKRWITRKSFQLFLNAQNVYYILDDGDEQEKDTVSLEIKEYISRQEAAELAGVSVSTVTKWMQSGEFQCVGAGKVLRVHRQQFLNWLNEHRSDITWHLSGTGERHTLWYIKSWMRMEKNIQHLKHLLRRKKQINGKKKLSTSSLSENLRFKSVQH